jgi:hypothetical protein
MLTLPKRMMSPNWFMHSLTLLTIIPYSLSFHSFTDPNAISDFHWFFACQ